MSATPQLHLFPGAPTTSELPADGQLAVHDAATCKLLGILTGHRSEVTAMEWSPDGRWLASKNKGDNHRIRLYDGKTLREVATLVDEDQGLQLNTRCLAWSPDSTYLSAGAEGDSFLIWEVETLNLVRRLNVFEPRSISRSAKRSPAEDRIANAETSGTILILDAITGRILKRLVGHNGMTIDISWSPDGNRLVSGGNDKRVRVWDTATGFQCLTLPGHDGPVTSVSWSPDGTRIASASNDRTIRIWDSVNRPKVSRSPR